ncbi:MAG TPA: GGDEF domain-containing protein, partial [Planctomycetota bacterium]|nr:GGDEF domain-containing protein [Planctomycetota bacterium]
LTGLYSRRHFENQLREHTNLARRYNKPLSLIMLDIDNFKLVNNQYGHLSGDAVLAEVGAVLKANVRDCDSVYRYGGEELAVILPETNATHSQAIAERLRRTIQEKAFIAGRNSIRVTISLGIAELDHTSRAYDDLVSRADQALFDAKARGRNSTSIWTQEGPKAVT